MDLSCIRNHQVACECKIVCIWVTLIVHLPILNIYCHFIFEYDMIISLSTLLFYVRDHHIHCNCWQLKPVDSLVVRWVWTYTVPWWPCCSCVCLSVCLSVWLWIELYRCSELQASYTCIKICTPLSLVCFWVIPVFCLSVIAERVIIFCGKYSFYTNLVV